MSGNRLFLGMVGALVGVLVLSIDAVQDNLPAVMRGTLVGTAGEWFAGIAAVFVILWAVGEPARLAEHSRSQADDSEARKRLASARAVVIYNTALRRRASLLGGDSGSAFTLEGTVGNFGSTPVLSVKLNVEWTPAAQQTITRAVHLAGLGYRRASADDGLGLGPFWLAGAIGPNATIDFRDGLRETELHFALGPEAGGHNEDVALIEVSFADIYGDHWVVCHRPTEPEVSVTLLEPVSPLWTTERRAWLAEV